MIEAQIDKLLKKHGRTFYWLAKETGISHTTLWRLKKRKALGINFDTLEKICQAARLSTGRCPWTFASASVQKQSQKEKCI
jgi:putative transcriptional regulator